MSPLDRITLAQQILDSLAAEQIPHLSAAKRQELAGRLAAHVADPTDVVPWEEIEADAVWTSGIRRE